MKTFFFLMLVLGASCSFKKNPFENETLKGHEELYSEPESIDHDLNEEHKRIIIASTNDIHGNYNSQTVYFKDELHGKQSVKVGGAEIIASYFKILEEEYKNIILVDSGDIFPAADNSLKSVQNFYSTLKYDAITVGLGDFNLKLPAGISSTSNLFQSFAKNSKTPLLLSNLYELKSARVVEWKGTLPHLIKEVNGVKVGIIGLIPDDVVSLTPVNNRVGFYVENMLQSTLRHSRLLRSLGAEIIVALTHQGLECGDEIAEKKNLPLEKVNFDPNDKSACELESPLGQFLKRLPPNLVDVVVAGRNGRKVANYINSTLVMSGLAEGKSFNYVEFFVDPKTKKVSKDLTVVHQPVYFCHEFFKETKDCFTGDPTIDHSSRIPATFLGKEIRPDEAMKVIFPDPKPEKNSGVNFIKALETLHADIIYMDNKNDSQLYIVELNGHELAEILEEDYNRKSSSFWMPNPFQLEKNELSLKIRNVKFDRTQNYRILSNLSGLQNHRKLRAKIQNLKSQSFPTYSWNSLPSNDEVKSALSSYQRQ